MIQKVVQNFLKLTQIIIVKPTLTPAPGSPGGPGSPGKPTGPYRHIKTLRRLNMAQINCANSSNSRQLNYKTWHNDAVSESSNDASVITVCYDVADVLDYPWDHHLQGVLGHQRVQQLQEDQLLPSRQSLLEVPEKNASHSCHDDDHIMAIHTTLKIGL